MNIPTDWTKKPIKSVCLETEQWVPSKDKRDSFYYIDVSSVSNNTYSIKDASYVQADTAPGRARKIVRWQDTIFATVRPSLKRVAFIKREYDDQIVSTAFCVIRPNQKQVIPLYVYYFLVSDFLNGEIAGLQHGASYPAVTDKDILNQTIFLPPLPEQKKIAAVLFKIQQAIEIQESIIEKTRELKKSTLHHVFTHGLHGERLKETEIGQMPDSWDMGTIEDLCLLRNEICNPITSDSRVYVGLEHIESGKFILRNHGSPKEVRSTKNKFNQYDILYGKLRPYLDKVVVAEVDGICSTDILVLKPKGTTSTLFLIGLLHSDRFIQYANQTTRGVNHPRTSWTSLKDFSVPIPSSEEQKEIAHVFQSIDQKIELHTAQKSTLQDLLKTMLNKLMTGEIRVKDLDIDVSEVIA